MSDEVVCVDCAMAVEKVIKPFEIVDWYLYQRASDLVIFRDQWTTMIFDCSGQKLHIIIGNSQKLSYDWSPIIDTEEEPDRTRVRINMNPERTTRKVLADEDVIPFETLVRLRGLVKDPVTLRLLMRLGRKIF